MKSSINKIVLAVLASSIFLVAGCTPATVNLTATPAEKDIASTMASVSTSAVKTVEVQLTQTELAKPASTSTPIILTATATPEKISTKTDIPFPTQPTGVSQALTLTAAAQAIVTPNASFAFTSTPLSQPTTRPTVVQSSGSTTYQTWSCVFTPLSPSFGQVMRPADDFDAHWIIQNTGTSSWDPEEVDIRFLSGAEIYKKIDKVLLSEKININNTLDIVVDMSAPKQTGTYSAIWGVVKKGAVLCAVQIQIKVEN